MNRTFTTLLILVGVFLTLPATAVQFQFIQASDPASIVSQTNTYEGGIAVSTIAAPVSSGDYRLCYWTKDGVQQRDVLGAWVNPFGFILVQNTTATAVYRTVLADTDADGVPDWFELRYYTDTAQADATTDTDEDGLTLAEEYRREYHPAVKDTVRPGGLSLRMTETVAVVIDQGFARYTRQSDPLGLVAPLSQILAKGSPVSLPDVYATGGATFRFVQWEIDGTRIEDALGRATASHDFTLAHDSLAKAVFLPVGKDDDSGGGDGVPDWFEAHFYGTTDNPPTSDTDGDAFDLAEEYRRDYHPRLADRIRPGGLSIRMSESVQVIASPNYSRYSRESDPAGLLDGLGLPPNAIYAKGTEFVLPDLYGVRQGFQFCQWEQNGTRLTDAVGRALAGFALNLSEDTAIVARFLLPSQDDGDGVPDWFEMNFYGHFLEDATSDTDQDGFTLADEYERDYHPLLKDHIRPGGLAIRLSEETSVIVSSDYVRYVEASSPAGLIPDPRSGIYLHGTLFALPDLFGISNGHRFCQWEENDARLADAAGRALAFATVAPTVNTQMVARFLPVDEDLDGGDGPDGVPDWFELHFYGTTEYGPDTDSDGDGFDLAEEYLRDYHPGIQDHLRAGGLALRMSSSVSVDLQYFPRSTQALVDGTHESFFSGDGTVPGTFDAGDNSRPAFGDWDGDGDPDLFVGHAGGTVRVFENRGSPAVMNLVLRDDLEPGLVTGGGIFPACGDWNDDGTDDLAVADAGGEVAFFASDRTWDMLVRVADFGIDTGLTVTGLTFLDGTGDGLVDLVVLDDTGTLTLFPNRGTAPQFDLSSPVANFAAITVANATGIAAADVNADGLVDLLISDAVGRIWEYRQSPPGVFAAVSAVFGGTFDGFAADLAVTAADVDGDGDADVIGGFAEGGLVFLRHDAEHLGVTPNVKTVFAGEGVAFTASGRISGQVTWSFFSDASGATLDPDTGIYTAGSVSGIDCVVARDEAGLEGRAWINVLESGQVTAAGKAIVVAGRHSANDSVWPATHFMAGMAYRTLRYRGLAADSIQYLSHAWAVDPGVDGLPTRANLVWALTPGNLVDAATPSLMLCFADHGRQHPDGSDGDFILSEAESISGAEIAALLDDLQAACPGCDVTVVFECCYAGNLALPLIGNRAVMASAGAGELAHFISDGLVSFSQIFWSDIGLGLTVRNSFDDAALAMARFQAGEISDPTGLAEVQIGPDFIVGLDRPHVANVSPEQQLTDTETATIWAADATGPAPIQRAWAVVIPPGYATSGDAPVIDLPEIELAWNGAVRRWQATWSGFTEGDLDNPYTVLIYAQDIWGSVSFPRETQVTQTGRRKRVIVFAAGDPHGPDAGTYGLLADLALAACWTRRVQGVDLRYLSDFTAAGWDPAGPATKGGLQDAILTWAPTGGPLNSLALYLVGNGAVDGLRCANGDVVTPADLRGWLDQLEVATGAETSLVVECDYSGVFLQTSVGTPGRVVMTSTSAEHRTDLGFRGWTAFGRWFWAGVAHGGSLRSAFAGAMNAFRALTLSPSCLLDDTGDGIYRSKLDGRIAQQRFFGTAFVTGDDPPHIGRCGGSRVVPRGGSAFLWATDVVMPDGATPMRVWAEVLPPGHQEGDLARIVELVWREDHQRWLGVFSAFINAGIYAAALHAAATAEPEHASEAAMVHFYYDCLPPASGSEDESLPVLPVDGSLVATEIPAGQTRAEYRLYATAGNVITFELLNVLSGRDLGLTLYTGDRGTVLREVDDWGVGFGETILSWTVPNTDWYVLEVENIGFSALVTGNLRTTLESTSDGFVYTPVLPISAQLEAQLLRRTDLDQDRALAADLNGDGKIDVADLIWLLRPDER